ncbi:hypothetical protein JAAARDRAFT_591038 [Jaapia argillacea MUCL 33604]|uniref:Uncharacterized protein n=1 Tax=Jaapia argillacea MUCL 33604 TaxID=933084 RepID=A0A067PI48_9AGAM|nr:hypothetical protein JAAARDRAFT_591038 [Jaapia argillacea MUCL 33604]
MSVVIKHLPIPFQQSDNVKSLSTMPSQAPTYSPVPSLPLSSSLIQNTRHTFVIISLMQRHATQSPNPLLHPRFTHYPFTQHSYTHGRHILQSIKFIPTIYITSHSNILRVEPQSTPLPRDTPTAITPASRSTKFRCPSFSPPVPPAPDNTAHRDRKRSSDHIINHNEVRSRGPPSPIVTSER